MRGYVVLGGSRTAWRGFTTDGTDAAQAPTQISTDRGRYRCETSGRFAALAARRRGRATAEPDAPPQNPTPNTVCGGANREALRGGGQGPA